MTPAFTPPPHRRVAIHLRAATPLALPGWLGSTLHGLLGHALRRHDRATGDDLAARWLEPGHPPLPGWLGVSRVPPLVVRPPAVVATRRHLAAGAPLRFELVAIHPDPAAFDVLVAALAAQLPELPFGRRDQRVEVEDVRPKPPPPPLDPSELAAARTLRVAAHAPLVLRRAGELVDRPSPLDLALAATRRLAAVQAAYGGAAPELHLAELAQELTAELKVDRAHWMPFRQRRYSSRQRRRHPVRGTLGGALLSGPVGRLATLLAHAAPFGLGKGAALGLGAFDLSVGDD